LSTAALELQSQLDRFAGYLAQDPDNPDLANEVGQAHLRLGHFSEARDVLVRALTSHPVHPALRSTMASVAMASGQADEAIEILRGLIEGGYDHPVNRYNLAYALLYARRFAEARDQLMTVVDDPAIPEAPVLLARCLHHLGEMDEAIERLTSFLAKNPGHSDALGTLSLLQLDSMHTQDARCCAEQAIQLNPNDLNALLTLGTLALETQDDKVSTEHFEHVLRRHPKSGRAWSGLGLATMLRLDLPKAMEQLRQAVIHMPDHIGTWHALAWCQITANDLEGAKQSFEKSMEIDRSFAETHGGLAVIAALQNRVDEAQKLIKIALRLDPNSYAGRFAETLLQGKTDPAKAQAEIQKMLAAPLPGSTETLQHALQQYMRRATPAAKPVNTGPPKGTRKH
jgi:tetratricopeptide (TPR) repeat protein